MRRKTAGNTCARPISPTACSKTTPQSSTLASSHGAAFSTSSVASSPSPAVIGLLPVNHSEVWYYLKKLVHGSRSGRGLHFIADVPHFFSSQFLGILAKHGFDDHNGGPNELLSRLISEVEHPGG